MAKELAEEFSQIRLDGSALHGAWSQLYIRCAQLLRLAIEQKTAGRGIFARPEADPGLMVVLEVMEAIDPSAGWMERAFTTYAQSMQDALERAPDIWWGRRWLEPMETSQRYNSASLLCFPAFENISLVRMMQLLIAKATTGSPQGLSQLIFGCIPQELLEKPSGAELKRRRTLYDAIVQRSGVVRTLLQRPDGSFPSISAASVPELDRSLLKPLWRNKRVPPLPGNGEKFLRRFGDILMRTVSEGLDEAWTVLVTAPMLLGPQQLHEHYRQQNIPHYRLFVAHGHGVSEISRFLGIEILDRLFGAPPSELLSACLSFSRWMSWRTALAIKNGDQNLPIESWDAAIVSCMVEDESAMREWAEHYPTVSRGNARDVRACGHVLESWVMHRRWPADLKLPKTLRAIESGFATAMRGICDRDPSAASNGVREMLDAHRLPRTDPYLGNCQSELCLQAVAVQRIARKAGLVLDVPSGAPNDMELVCAANPTAPSRKWAVLPGLDLVTGSSQPLDWPSLYLNQPVLSVDDPPP